MNNDLVSIIIPTFNREILLTETLNSIKNQTYYHWECIVIDDQSTDFSVDLVKKIEKEDSRFKIFSRPNDKPKGANSCRNYGIEKATGDFIMFFDSDDLLKEDCLENRVFEINKNSDYDMLVFSMGIFDYHTKPKIDENRKVVNLNLKDTIIDFIFSHKLPWNVCRPIYKTSFIKNKIAFNEKIHNFQDDEFNLRVLYYLKPSYLSIDYTDCYYRSDIENVNKYNNLKGNQNIIDSLLEYYKTVFIVLDKDTKIVYRDKLIQKFFSQIKAHVQYKVTMQSINKVIRLFNEEINLSTKEYFILHGIKFLNNYFLNIKGYYFFSSKAKKMLFKINL
ncbi:MAG TPA: glycosyltransferase family 2 protein [Flavobacterium sp.]|jgi:glycosyltransferase involved in cell wall biosynthesis